MMRTGCRDDRCGYSALIAILDKESDATLYAEAIAERGRTADLNRHPVRGK
jgi:hypothetical protein